MKNAYEVFPCFPPFCAVLISPVLRREHPGSGLAILVAFVDDFIKANSVGEQAILTWGPPEDPDSF
jgi:hypothetical protein